MAFQAAPIAYEKIMNSGNYILCFRKWNMTSKFHGAWKTFRKGRLGPVNMWDFITRVMENYWKVLEKQLIRLNLHC